MPTSPQPTATVEAPETEEAAIASMSDEQLAMLDPETLSDEELDELLIREITIDGMCGVY